MNREVKYGQTCGYSEGDVCCCDFSLTSIMFGLSLGEHCLGGTLIGGEQEVQQKRPPLASAQCTFLLSFNHATIGTGQREQPHRPRCISERVL